ncbi:hypothetical protein [Mastigocladopsis repens]|uniref:hypothetical protein n=1 Tax=Mastigocladopsis repens TaxID=221287 RepID=UPI0002D6AC76|nr:hypothetical protein [Mastigocladopsis repens]
MKNLNFTQGRVLKINSISPAFATKSTNYTVIINDFVLAGDCTNNPITFTLGANIAGWYKFKKVDSSANAVTITTNNNKLIEGSATLQITARGNSVDLMVDQLGNWWIV